MRRGGQAGLTLVELMIAVVISGLVISAALAMGFSMMNGYRDHRAMVEVERSARVSLEIMADAIRNASPGVPAGEFTDAIGCPGTNNVVGLEVINSTDAPDELKVIYATGGIFTAVYQTPGYMATDTTVTVLDAEEVDDEDFVAGDYIVVTNLDSAVILPVTAVSAGFACGTPNPATCYTLTVPAASACGDLSTWPGAGFETGSLVIRARYAHFYIEDDATVGLEPTLMMDPDADGPLEAEPIAEGIEDMQIAVAVDADTSGSIEELGAAPNDDEWYYNVDGDPAPPNLVERALRITLIAKSTREQSEVNSYERPAAEDRAADGVKDPFRRRVLTTVVEIRNLNGSP